MGTHELRDCRHRKRVCSPAVDFGSIRANNREKPVEKRLSAEPVGQAFQAFCLTHVTFHETMRLTSGEQA
jgi:hypothetical protein